MNRTLRQWRNCDPAAMALQSRVAIMYACRDAKEDIAELEAALREAVAALNRVANLNEHAGEIGDGMLRTIVAEARAVVGSPTVTGILGLSPREFVLTDHASQRVTP